MTDATEPNTNATLRLPSKMDNYSKGISYPSVSNAHKMENGGLNMTHGLRDTELQFCLGFETEN